MLNLTSDQRRELLALLTQERVDIQTDEQVLTDLGETLRRQLSLSASTDLAEGFRRRMIRIANELEDEDHGPAHYDFQSDRAIAQLVLDQVRAQATALSSDADGEFMADFAKTFKTMSQDRRAAWLREAAMASSRPGAGEAAAQNAADAAREKSSADQTAMRIAADVAGIAFGARKKMAAGAGLSSLAAAPLGLVAGGAVAYALRRRRAAAERARTRANGVQVRRERQATQAVVTTCAYVLAAEAAGPSRS